MKLYFYGHELVSQPAYQRVDSIEGLAVTRDRLIAMMKRHGFKGIAAPQVGIPIQLVIVQLVNGSFLDLVNPDITRMYGHEEEKNETCISCPPHDNGCPVPRMDTIHMRASHVGNLRDVAELKFEGINARRIQHEVDHLEGTFFLHRASIKDRVEVMRRFRNWRHEWKLINGMKGEPWLRQPQ